MNITNMAVANLKPNPNNPRINDHAVDRVAAAINKFGFRVPILVKSTGEVIDGHLRLKAAQTIGLESVPVIIADDMSEAETSAFRISVNRMAELAEWNLDQLNEELKSLADIGFDVSSTGFDFEFAIFNPRLEPKADTREITDEDVTKIFDKQNSRFDNAGKELADLKVVCPHCMEEFEVSGT